MYVAMDLRSGLTVMCGVWLNLMALVFLVDYGKVSDEWAGTVRRGL